jgi:hypothetical protein
VNTAEIMRYGLDVKLKNLKNYPGLFDDAKAFEAELWIEGKKAADVQNDGTGKPNSVHFIDNDLQAKFYFFCTVQPSADRPGTREVDPGHYISGLVEDALYNEWLAQQRKPICQKCGKVQDPAKVRCNCGEPFDHRGAFPEQYTHPLCGKTVRVVNSQGFELGAGVLVRAHYLRYCGEFAYLEGQDDRRMDFRIQDCVPAPAPDAPSTPLYYIKFYNKPLGGDYPRSWDIRHAWVNADNPQQAEKKLRAKNRHFDEIIDCSPAEIVVPLENVNSVIRIY